MCETGPGGGTTADASATRALFEAIGAGDGDGAARALAGAAIEATGDAGRSPPVVAEIAREPRVVAPRLERGAGPGRRTGMAVGRPDGPGTRRSGRRAGERGLEAAGGARHP
jgi:hypothetical protein